jgi:hypothetical protein
MRSVDCGLPNSKQSRAGLFQMRNVDCALLRLWAPARQARLDEPLARQGLWNAESKVNLHFVTY